MNPTPFPTQLQILRSIRKPAPPPGRVIPSLVLKRRRKRTKVVRVEELD